MRFRSNSNSNSITKPRPDRPWPLAKDKRRKMGSGSSRPKESVVDECPTPVGFTRSRTRSHENEPHDPGQFLPALRVMSAGTTCVDVSTIGCQAGLLGPSSRTLAIFLQEVKLVQPDLVVHECTGKFLRDVFLEHLPDYHVYGIDPPEAW